MVHIASPFPLEIPKDESLLIEPAVNGTREIMEACKKYKVKRVVITSGTAACSEMKSKNKPKDAHYDNTHWSDPSPGPHISAYEKSKTLAEKLVWEF